MSDQAHQPPEGETDAHHPPRLPAVAYPLLGALFGAVLVWSFSRILLASGKDEAVAIAILMALNVLVGSALVAYGRRVRGRPLAFPLIVFAALGLIAVGATASVVWGDRAPKKAEAGGGPKPEVVSLTAQGIKFAETKLSFTAGAKVELKFDNKDSGTPHNFVLFNGPDANAPQLFRGEVVTGPIVTTYAFTAPAKPGDYFFHCEIHPTMTGTATVVAGGQAGGPPPGGGGGSGPLELHAKNIAFSPTTLTAASPDVTIHFVNDDANTPHNVAVFDGSDANAPAIVHGDLVTGPGSEDIKLTLPGPGTYFFHCDVHPQMTGTITLR
jgi:plastocyanin